MWGAIQSTLLWIASLVNFLASGLLLLLWLAFVRPHRSDLAQRLFCRNILRCAGARLTIHYAPKFDASRTVIIVSNHVNIFDPYVLYSSVPQVFRGVELASHFKIPVYGWIARWHGNIPVPDGRERGALLAMTRRIRRALEGGSSLLVFPEGHRTRSGRVEAFEHGIFRIIAETGYPILPVSIVGSFQHHRTGGWLLRPRTIHVYLHELVESKDLAKTEIDGLRQRVHGTIAAPVRASLTGSPPPARLAAYRTAISYRAVRSGRAAPAG